MNGDNELSSSIWLHVLGLDLHESLLMSLLITLFLGGVARLMDRHLSSLTASNLLQTGAEACVNVMRNAVAEVIPEDKVDQVLPFIGTLWLFILVANLLGLIPGLSAPTRDLSVTAALATLVFLAVHGFGVQAAGWKAYLRHYLTPSPIMLPFHLVSEFTRTLALAIRLFGNMMSLEMAALLVLLVAGLLVPIPLLMLHVVEALIQAYIFGMLALLYIGSAIEARDSSSHQEPTT